MRLFGAGLLLMLTLSGCGARSAVTTPTPQPDTPTPPAAATATQASSGADGQTATAETPTPPAAEDAPSTLRVSVFLANARACPTLECEVILLLEEGTVVSVRQSESGEEVDGSSLWYEVSVEGQAEPVYLHSSVVQAVE